MVKKILDVKNPILRQVSKPVAKIDKKILELVSDMQDTLKAQSDPEGVGLAAPQIGKNLQIFLLDYKGRNLVVMNPEIISMDAISKKQTEKREKVLEGCLSLPHYYGPVKRAKNLTLKYMNLAGDVVTEDFKGFLAHIVQHEVDHLNGKLFIDKILEQKASLYKFDGDEWEEVDLV